MITNKREQKICDIYSAYGTDGHVHCYECPLKKGNPDRYDFRCKANSHFNRHTGEWEYDDNGNIPGEDIFEDVEAFKVAKQFMDVPENFGSYEVNKKPI